MSLPPSLSSEQRQAALQKATEVRRQRAEMKSRLKMGSITFAELCAEASTDPGLGKMKVLTVLESLPGLGKVKARRLMEELGISETRRLQGLGENQFKKLTEKLSDS